LPLLPLAACQTAGPPVAERPDHSLTLIVTELQMHLRDDTYRAFRARGVHGRDVFQQAISRLERLQSQRAVPQDQWGKVDLVIEYARARALERSRRYLEAMASYRRVAQVGSLVAERAADEAAVLTRFAEQSGPPAEPHGSGEQELEWLRARVSGWAALASELRGTSYEPLALEELEAWSMLRVDALLRWRSAQQAIDAAQLMIERHRTSKLHARHLLRLGDLYAEAARREHLRSRVEQKPLDTARYDELLDGAFAAYELAGEERRPGPRVEAAKKIDALLAAQRGLVSNVR
jgi:hypothetical protein